MTKTLSEQLLGALGATGHLTQLRLGATNFEDIIFWDFEFISKPGKHPDVVCLAWHSVSTGQTHRLWRDELGDQPPFRIDDKVLCVCFVGNAELCCHLALDWSLPVNVLDLSAEFRCITNGRTMPGDSKLESEGKANCFAVLARSSGPHVGKASAALH